MHHPIRCHCWRYSWGWKMSDVDDYEVWSAAVQAAANKTGFGDNPSLGFSWDVWDAEHMAQPGQGQALDEISGGLVDALAGSRVPAGAVLGRGQYWRSVERWEAERRKREATRRQADRSCLVVLVAVLVAVGLGVVLLLL